MESWKMERGFGTNEKICQNIEQVLLGADTLSSALMSLGH